MRGGRERQCTGTGRGSVRRCVGGAKEVSYPGRQAGKVCPGTEGGRVVGMVVVCGVPSSARASVCVCVCSRLLFSGRQSQMQDKCVPVEIKKCKKKRGGAMHAQACSAVVIRDEERQGI